MILIFIIKTSLKSIGLNKKTTDRFFDNLFVYKQKDDGIHTKIENCCRGNYAIYFDANFIRPLNKKIFNDIYRGQGKHENPEKQSGELGEEDFTDLLIGKT